MKRVQLAAVEADESDDNLVLLVEKGKTDLLHGVLQPAEFDFLQQIAGREINTCFFPRPTGTVFIRILKADKDPMAALEAARAEEVKCLEALQIAIRNREKLDSHKSLWTEDFHRAEQMAEDLVMEETAESAYLRQFNAEPA